METIVQYRDYEPRKVTHKGQSGTVEWVMQGSTAVLNRADAGATIIKESADEVEKLPFVQAVDREL